MMIVTKFYVMKHFMLVLQRCYRHCCHCLTNNFKLVLLCTRGWRWIYLLQHWCKLCFVNSEWTFGSCIVAAFCIYLEEICDCSMLIFSISINLIAHISNISTEGISVPCSAIAKYYFWLIGIFLSINFFQVKTSIFCQSKDVDFPRAEFCSSSFISNKDIQFSLVSYLSVLQFSIITLCSLPRASSKTRPFSVGLSLSGYLTCIKFFLLQKE